VMGLQKLMQNYAEFNLWANGTIVRWLQEKPAGLLNKEVPSSYPTIAKTLVHVWSTELFWHSVLQDVSPPPVFREHFDGTNDEIMAGLLLQSQELAAYVAVLTEEKLQQICTLDAPWMKGRLPKYEYIQHCINHSTYHRGQIITIGRNTGLTDPPMTDYNYYNMVVKV
jgi:uncharacterized damage-inducible protein DinB